MSMCRVFSCVVGRGCLLWPVCSLGKTVTLWSASFFTTRPNFPVTPGISWLSTFAFESAIMVKEMATHSSSLAWKIPWMEEPGRLYSPWGCKELDTTEQLHFHFSLSCTGEGNGSSLQYSCLENPRGRGAWRAAVYGVAQGWTRLKWPSSSSSC